MVTRYRSIKVIIAPAVEISEIVIVVEMLAVTAMVEGPVAPASRWIHCTMVHHVFVPVSPQGRRLKVQRCPHPVLIGIVLDAGWLSLVRDRCGIDVRYDRVWRSLAVCIPGLAV